MAQTQTFLFADLVGFTALAELEGDDRALEVVLALQGRVRKLLVEQLDGLGAARSGESGGGAADLRTARSGESRGGAAGKRDSRSAAGDCRPAAEQVKAIGDGLMLRCDEPEAAIRLGLRLVDELGDEPGMPPVRVGIHTGPAVANDGDWYGRTVNVAARLCAVAPGGEVMVSEATRAAAGAIHDVDWGERELHWLRNVSEPVGTYLASRCEGRRVVAAGPRARRWSCPRRAVQEATA